MLDSNELVALLPGFDKCHVQAYFEFLGDHGGPFESAANKLLTAYYQLP
jgi:hypothetical protein